MLDFAPMGLLTRPRISIEAGWPGGPIYMPQPGSDDDEPPRRTILSRTEARQSDVVPMDEPPARIDTSSPGQTPPSNGPLISQGFDFDAPEISRPSVATAPVVAGPPSRLDRFRELQRQEDAYRQSHATYNPQTGEWKAKPISRAKAIGLAALRGLFAGPGGAIGGALVGAIDPGRVAQSRYESGLGKIRSMAADELQRAGVESNIDEREWERTHPRMTSEPVYQEGVPEDVAQPQMYNRDPYGNLSPQKTPTGAPVYGTPKPIKPPPIIKPHTRVNVGEIPGLQIGVEYEVDEKGKPRLDEGGWPFATKPAPPETPTDQTALRQNAERAAKANAAGTLAAHYGAQAAEDEKNLRAAEAEVSRLDQLIAPMRKTDVKLPTLQKERADAAERVKIHQKAWDENSKNQKIKEAEQKEYSQPLPTEKAPTRTGYHPPAMPKGAASPQQADAIFKRAAQEGKTVYSSDGQPLQNPYARQ